MHDVSPANGENVGDPDPVFHLPGMFWMIKLGGTEFLPGADGSWHLKLANQLEFDRLQIFGPGNIRTRLNLDTTYTVLPGAPQHITPQTHDPTSPFNWAGLLWNADAKSTFSFAYEDGSFSVTGTVDNASSVEGVIPGHAIYEKNGVYAQ